MKYTFHQQQQIIELKEKGYSSRSISKLLGVSKSGVNDYYSSYLNNQTLSKNGPRVLLFDLETSAALVYCFGRHKQFINQDAIQEEGGKILCAGYRWLGEENTTVINYLEDVKLQKDSKVCKDLWNLFNAADVVVAHNCVTLDTPVLKADMQWVNIGDIKVGDELVGFDEGKSPFTKAREGGKWVGVKGKNRQIRPSIVTDYSIHEKECVEVLLDNGDIVTTTKDHYWLGKAEKDQNLRWYTSESLRKGQRVVKYMNTWENDKSYESGWISGFIDGEGSLSKSVHGVPSSIQFCQRPGVVWDKMLRLCAQKKLTVSANRTPKTGGLGKQDCLYANIQGGKWEVIETISKFNIERMKSKINWNNFGQLSGGCEVKIVSVTPVGLRKVAVMGTSTSTFFAKGYAMHNCKNFDIKMLAARCLSNGLPPLPSVQVLDTLQMARKGFRFPSNKLDSLGEYFKIGRKVSHSGIKLWVDVQQGSTEAIGKMVEYCAQDVDLLYEVFVLLQKQGLASGVNFAAYYDDSKTRCKSCGSDNLEFTGKQFTSNTGIFDEVHCKDCGASHRSKYNKLPTAKRKNFLV